MQCAIAVRRGVDLKYREFDEKRAAQNFEEAMPLHRYHVKKIWPLDYSYPGNKLASEHPHSRPFLEVHSTLYVRLQQFVVSLAKIDQHEEARISLGSVLCESIIPVLANYETVTGL